MGAEFWADKVLTALVTLAATWAGVRLELRHLREQVAEVKEAVQYAHGRIDRILERTNSHEPITPPGVAPARR